MAQPVFRTIEVGTDQHSETQEQKDAAAPAVSVRSSSVASSPFRPEPAIRSSDASGSDQEYVRVRLSSIRSSGLRRSPACRAGWRRRVERLLEVRLDLGVVGGEDAVAGVGGLAMDGSAAIKWRFRGVAQCPSVRRC